LTLTTLTLSGLTTLRALPRLLACLLARLPWLSAAAKLARLLPRAARLALSGLGLSRLTLARPGSRLRISTSPEAGELIAQAREIVHRPVQVGILGSVLGIAEGMRGIADLGAELVQVAGEGGFGWV
jgi:hypothetical protein